MKTRFGLLICLSILLILSGCKEDQPQVADSDRPRSTDGHAAVQQTEPAQASTAMPSAGTPKPAQTERPDEQPAPPQHVHNGAGAQTEHKAGEADYFAVMMEGKKVGHAVQTRSVSGETVTTNDSVSISITRMGIPITIKMSETHIETVEGEPLAFEAIQELSAMVTRTSGRVDPNGTVFITSKSMGAEQKSTMPWPEGALMAEGLRLLQEDRGAEEGLEYELRIFSPASLTAMDATIRFGGKKKVDLLGRVVYLREMTKTYTMPGAGKITSTSYLDDDLVVQKDTVPLAGMTIEIVACPKEFALSDNDVLELINKMFLESPVEIANPGSALSIGYHLKASGPEPIEPDNFPSTDNQTAKALPDGDVFLVVKPVAAPSGVNFPYTGDDPALLEALESTSFLQTKDPAIVKLAREAVGDAEDAAEAVKRIESFVANYMTEAGLSVGYASASEVAGSRQGDCSEFAVLTAALCRAVGIPAEVVVGVAYVEDFGGIEGFGEHAWTRAYVGGKWVGLDSAFKSSGRGGYDAGHIALAIGNGEPADFFNLATTLGRFDIFKVVVKRK